MQPFRIAKLIIIHHFTPRHQIGTCTDRIIAFKTIGTIGLYLPTNETIGMLLGVKIIQCTLKRKETGTITGEHQNKRRIPHEYIAIIGRIKIT